MTEKMKKFKEYSPEYYAKSYEEYKKKYEEMLTIGIDKNRKEYDLTNTLNEKWKDIPSPNGNLEAQIDKSGHVEILNKDTGDRGSLDINLDTHNIESEISSEDEKYIADSYCQYAVTYKGKEVLPLSEKGIPDLERVQTALKKNVEMASDNPGHAAIFQISGVEFVIMMNSDRSFDIEAKEDFYCEVDGKSDSRKCSLLKGEGLTEEELTSKEAAEKIVEAAGIGAVMKGEKALQEELSRTKDVNLDKGAGSIEERTQLTQEEKAKEVERKERSADYRENVIASTPKDVVKEKTTTEKGKPNKAPEEKSYTVVGDNDIRTAGSLDEAKQAAVDIASHEKYTQALDGTPVTGPLNGYEDPRDIGDHSFNPYGEDVTNPNKDFEIDDDEPERSLID